VRRTQLYLDDHLWAALHARARTQRTTVSELVRQAIREHYLTRHDERKQAMQAFVGIRKQRSGTTDSVKYVQGLRRGNRIERLNA
jgi:metal-responsive CopG/Arc/MetJ family transcriptional regulator